MKPNQIAAVLSCVLLATLIVCGVCAAQPATAPSSDTKSVVLPGTQVRVMVPNRYVLDQRGSAWIDEKQQIIIAGHTLPLSVDQAIEVFEKKAKTEGFAMAGDETRLYDGRPVKYRMIADKRGYTTLFFVFEAGGKTVAASGIHRSDAPKAIQEEVSRTLASARLDASVQEDPFDTLPYRADLPPRFMRAASFPNGVMVSEDGKPVGPADRTPRLAFIARDRVEIPDLQAFIREQFTAAYPGGKIASVELITANTAPGAELIGTFEEHGNTMSEYMAVVVGRRYVYVIEGTSPNDDTRAQYIEQFKRAVHTLRANDKADKR